MKIERFEDIVAWQKGRELTVLIYRLFEANKDFSFRDQIETVESYKVESRKFRKI
jgi:hypothetical protein